MRTRLDEIVEEEWTTLFPARSIGPTDRMRARDQRIAERAFRHGVERRDKHPYFGTCSPPDVQPGPPGWRWEQPAPAGEKWYRTTTMDYGTKTVTIDHSPDRRKGERRKVAAWTRVFYGERQYWGWVDGKETGGGRDRRLGKDRRK